MVQAKWIVLAGWVWVFGSRFLCSGERCPWCFLCNLLLETPHLLVSNCWSLSLHVLSSRLLSLSSCQAHISLCMSHISLWASQHGTRETKLLLSPFRFIFQFLPLGKWYLYCSRNVGVILYFLLSCCPCPAHRLSVYPPSKIALQCVPLSPSLLLYQSQQHASSVLLQ